MELLLSARNCKELQSKLASIDVEVPSHTKDRENRHVETYSLVSLLTSIPWKESCFPIEIYRRERPDFCIRCGACEIGLEHTEGTNQNISKERALRADGHGPETHFITAVSIYDKPKPKKDVIAEIVADKSGDGWCGDSVERNWAEAMAFFIDKKVSNAKKDGYQLYGNDRLMIYDNWPAPMLQHQNAIPHLREHLKDSRVWSVFNHVYIVDEHAVVEITANGTIYHRVKR